MTDRVAVHIRVEGRVQGVGYRAWTAATARGLGLSGWVRNRRDGAVEALIAGPAADVESMVGRCRRGPPDARVDRLEVIGEGVSAADGFDVLPTE
jgi:acylphosphatase